MEPLRQLRFIFPPTVFIGALFLAKWASVGAMIEALGGIPGPALTAAGALVAASVIPLGFILGGVTTIVLVLVFRMAGWPPYEVVLERCQIDRLLKELNIQFDAPRTSWVPASRSFIYALNSKTFDLLDRHWEASNAYAGAAFALPISAGIFAYGTGDVPRCSWWWVALVFVAVFWAMAWRSRTIIRQHVDYYLQVKGSGGQSR